MCWGSCASKGGKEESWFVFDRETRRDFVDFENSIRVRVYFERRKQPTGKCCVISFPVPSLVIIVLKWSRCEGLSFFVNKRILPRNS